MLESDCSQLELAWPIKMTVDVLVQYLIDEYLADAAALDVEGLEELPLLIVPHLHQTSPEASFLVR